MWEKIPKFVWHREKKTKTEIKFDKFIYVKLIKLNHELNQDITMYELSLVS